MEKLLYKTMIMSKDIYTNNNKYDFFLSDIKSGLQVGILVEDTNIYCIFRGSKIINDFIHDLEITKIKLDNGIHVHRGFYEQLHEHNNFIFICNFINNLIINKKYELIITGHSLGGALATLFAYEYNKINTNLDIKVISFASPRVGDKKWKKSFNSKLYHLRVTNNHDPIPFSPSYFYYHTGYNIILNKDNSYFPYYNIIDHQCDKYLEGIGKFI